MPWSQVGLCLVTSHMVFCQTRAKEGHVSKRVLAVMPFFWPQALCLWSAPTMTSARSSRRQGLAFIIARVPFFPDPLQFSATRQQPIDPPGPHSKKGGDDARRGQRRQRKSLPALTSSPLTPPSHQTQGLGSRCCIPAFNCLHHQW
jgi:hypothetical protein